MANERELPAEPHERGQEKQERAWVTNTKSGVSVAVKGTLGLLPGGSYITEAINAVEDRAQKRELQALKRAIENYGKDLESLGRKLRDDENLGDLWVRGAVAARTARTREKVEAFAAILAGAVDANPSELVIANSLITVLEGLEAEHIHIVAAIRTETAQPPKRREEGKLLDPGARIEDLEVRLPGLKPMIGVFVNILVANKLARNIYEGTWFGGGGVKLYVLTELGESLLQHLSSMAERSYTGE